MAIHSFCYLENLIIVAACRELFVAAKFLFCPWKEKHGIGQPLIITQLQSSNQIGMKPNSMLWNYAPF
jgi:hypothetical protein